MTSQNEKANPKIPGDLVGQPLTEPGGPNISSKVVMPASENPLPAQPPAGRVTRASNKTNRPGLVDISPPPQKKRRTGAELIQHKQDVANSKQARKDAAARAIEVQQQQQLEVAHMEDSIANEEENSRINAARPPLGEIRTKVSRPVSNVANQVSKNIEKDLQAAAPATGCVSEHSGGDHEDDEDYQPSDDGEKTGQSGKKRKRTSSAEGDALNEIETTHINQVQPPSPIRRAPGKSAVKKVPAPTIREQVQGQRMIKERRADNHSSTSRQEFAATSRTGPSDARLGEGNESHRHTSNSAPIRNQSAPYRPATPVLRATTGNATAEPNIHLSSRWESTAPSGIRPKQQALSRRPPPAATQHVPQRPAGTHVPSQSGPRLVPVGRIPSAHYAHTLPGNSQQRASTTTSTAIRQAPHEAAARPQIRAPAPQSAQVWQRLPPAVVRSNSLGSRSTTPRSSTPSSGAQAHSSDSSSTRAPSSDFISEDNTPNARQREEPGFHRSRTQHRVIADVVPRRSAERQQKVGSRKKDKDGGYSLSDLPPGTESGWSNVLIPLWNQFSGSLDNPWDTSDNNILQDLIAIWEIAFPNVPVEITRKCAIYALALQKWYDWRGRISRRAQSALKTILERFKPGDRLAYAEWLLSDGMPCMWQNAAEPGKFVGLYRSELMLKTFSEHVSSTNKVPEEDQLGGRPIGALALAAVSVERAIKLYIKNTTRDDPDAKEENDRFSESKYGALTIQYVESIKKLKPSAWDLIIKEASLFVKESKDVSEKGGAGMDADSLDPNRRANLEELSEDDESSGGHQPSAEHTARTGYAVGNTTEYHGDVNGSRDSVGNTAGDDYYDGRYHNGVDSESVQDEYYTDIQDVGEYDDNVQVVDGENDMDDEQVCDRELAVRSENWQEYDVEGDQVEGGEGGFDYMY